MAQFIQYLYEYENGRRVRSLGFMKAEKQMDKTVIQIYAKQLDEVAGVQFRREDGSRYIAAWEDEEEPTSEEMAQEPVSEEAPNEPTVSEEPVPGSGPGEEEEEPVSAYVPPRTVRYEKIQRQDLSRLPRREWRLANNSFLLHGFYNYHHLLYIEEDGNVWVGVPGIYHEKEKAAADAFGFPVFRRLTDMELELELSDEEKDTYEDFGYWCRQISR